MSFKFIVLSHSSHGWYICADLDDDEFTSYLHSDLVVRKSTIYQGEFLGYYDTEELANATVFKYMQKHGKIVELEDV